MSNTKVYHIENRKSWKNEYGIIIKHLPSITETLAFVQKYKSLDKEPLRIVDYGCAYGYYLSILKIINPNHDLYGVDCAKEAVESTARIVGNDHTFWARCGEPLPLEDNSVDVILCFDVIEHVKDKNELIAFFKECARLIKPQGYVFIRTPNCNFPMRVLFRLAGKSWIYKGKEHPSPFTEKKLANITEPYLRTIEVSYAAGIIFKYRLLHRLKVSPHFTFVLTKLVQF